MEFLHFHHLVSLTCGGKQCSGIVVDLFSGGNVLAQLEEVCTSLSYVNICSEGCYLLSCFLSFGTHHLIECIHQDQDYIDLTEAV